MSKKSEIIKKFKGLISDLKKHNKFYYLEDSPKISDSEYDLLKRNILELEEVNPFLKKIEAVSNIIGANPSNKFKKIKHLIPMLSLSNAFVEKDIEDFLKKINNFLNLKKNDIELISEPKIDGIVEANLSTESISVVAVGRGADQQQQITINPQRITPLFCFFKSTRRNVNPIKFIVFVMYT